MGTWSAAIDGNDTFQDVYTAFFDLYNRGVGVEEISKKILADHQELFEDYEDKNNALFALALAQWETQSLGLDILNKVKQIIENDEDIDFWKSLNADPKSLIKRKAVLYKFLLTISIPRDKIKRRIKPKFVFSKNTLVSITAPDHLKTFEISEEFENGEYINTGSLMLWKDGGGSVFYFNGQNKQIAAKWLDSQTLEITYEKGINFTKRDTSAYFSGDSIAVIYKAI